MPASTQKATFTRPIQYDEALVTSLVPYGESDCIVRLFLQGEGRRLAFYKRGLSCSKNRPGTIQAPCFATIGFIDAQDNKLAKLVSCDIDPSKFINISSLRIVGFGCYIAELIERFLPEEEPAPEIFGAALESFAAIAQLGAQPHILRAFELKLLDFCGYLPELNVAIAPTTAYDPSTCQFLSSPTPESLGFCDAAIELALTMLEQPVGQTECHDLELLRLLGNIFLGRLRLLGGAPLKSIAFLNQVKVG